MNDSIAFIGAGSMAEALIAGLLASRRSAKTIIASHPRRERRDELHARYAIRTEASNANAARDAQICVLCVKPKLILDVASEVSVESAKRLTISVAVGVTLDELAKRLEVEAPVVRAMPSQPVIVGRGLTGIVASPTCTAADKKRASDIFGAVGQTFILPSEEALHAFAAVAASGPGFLYDVARGAEAGAAQVGLAPELIRTLVSEVFIGAGLMMAKDHEAPLETLRRRVASPGGITEAGLAVLTQHKAAEALSAAIVAATEKSREMQRKERA